MTLHLSPVQNRGTDETSSPFGQSTFKKTGDRWDRSPVLLNHTFTKNGGQMRPCPPFYRIIRSLETENGLFKNRRVDLQMHILGIFSCSPGLRNPERWFSDIFNLLENVSETYLSALRVLLIWGIFFQWKSCAVLKKTILPQFQVSECLRSAMGPNVKNEKVCRGL